MRVYFYLRTETGDDPIFFRHNGKDLDECNWKKMDCVPSVGDTVSLLDIHNKRYVEYKIIRSLWCIDEKFVNLTLMKL